MALLQVNEQCQAWTSRREKKDTKKQERRRERKQDQPQRQEQRNQWWNKRIREQEKHVTFGFGLPSLLTEQQTKRSLSDREDARVSRLAMRYQEVNYATLRKRCVDKRRQSPPLASRILQSVSPLFAISRRYLAQNTRSRQLEMASNANGTRTIVRRAACGYVRKLPCPSTRAEPTFTSLGS